MPPELVSRVFELFVQGNPNPRRADAGLGLGLTIVKRLVEMHGGGVHAASDGPGLGSVFTVRLPTTSAPAVAAPSPSPDTEVRPRRIVLVEDDEDARGMLRHALELSGHEVHEAEDGLRALALVVELRPQVVVLDIGLAGDMSGYEVARRIRDSVEGRSVLLVALTGYARPEDHQRSREAGIDRHVVKPVDPIALARLLGEARDVSPPT